MPKYRVLEPSFIGHSLRNPGDIVDYDGEASANLELVEDEDAPAKPKRGKAKPVEETADAETEADGEKADALA